MILRAPKASLIQNLEKNYVAHDTSLLQNNHLIYRFLGDAVNLLSAQNAVPNSIFLKASMKSFKIP